MGLNTFFCFGFIKHLFYDASYSSKYQANYYSKGLNYIIGNTNYIYLTHQCLLVNISVKRKITCRKSMGDGKYVPHIQSLLKANNHFLHALPAN